MKNINVNFRYKCIEEIMRLNNGPALIYMARRSNLNLDDFVPGTQKSYMQMAIEYGANGVISSLLREGDATKKAINAIPHLLGEEKKTLIFYNDEKAQSKKMMQLFAIASALIETGAELKHSLSKVKIKTPIVKYLQSSALQMS